MADEVLLGVDGGIATITLNRPEKRNALNQDLDDLARRARRSADAHEGRRAMLEKRTPRFRGE
jgi:enoyl-CoA hydratase/carnithine racemase